MDTRALARAATAIENRTPQGLELLDRLQPGTGISAGITGPPGAGKSSLVDALVKEIRQRGKTAAILAVDPTSRVTGGAILGDRIRMLQHHGDEGVFIRSMATRGATGGLARTTADLVKLLRGAGFDYVLIETVGVGQDEIDVAAIADVTVLVLVPGMGDDIQAIKAGVMEVADIYAINKADHPGADRAEHEIRAVSSAPILRTVAIEGTGVVELLDAIDAGASMTASKPVTTGRFTIDHVGIAVRSIEQALHFYEGALGMKPLGREKVAQEKVNVAMLPAGESRIELLEATQDDSTVARFIEKRGEGIHHLALKVADFEGVVNALRNSGARLLNEPRRGAGGHRYVFVHPASAGGVLLEIIAE